MEGPGRWFKAQLTARAESVVDLDFEMADGAFELRMSEEQLYGSQLLVFL